MRFKNTKYKVLSALEFTKPKNDLELNEILKFKTSRSLLQDKFITLKNSPNSFTSPKKRHRHNTAKKEFIAALQDVRNLSKSQSLRKLSKSKIPQHLPGIVITHVKANVRQKLNNLKQPKDDFYATASPNNLSSFSQVTTTLSLGLFKPTKKQNDERYTKDELIGTLAKYHNRTPEKSKDFINFLENRYSDLKTQRRFLTLPNFNNWILQAKPLTAIYKAFTRMQNGENTTIENILTETCYEICDNPESVKQIAESSKNKIYSSEIQKKKFDLNREQKIIADEIDRWIKATVARKQEKTPLMININCDSEIIFIGNKTELLRKTKNYLITALPNLAGSGISNLKISIETIDVQKTLTKTKDSLMLWYKPIIENMLAQGGIRDESAYPIFVLKEKAIDALIHHCNKHKDVRAINLINLIANKEVPQNIFQNSIEEANLIGNYAHEQITISAQNGNKWAVDSLITLANNFATNELVDPLIRIANRSIANSSLNNARFNTLCSYTQEQILMAAENKNSWALLQQARWEIDDLTAMAANKPNKRLMHTIAAVANNQIKIPDLSDAQLQQLAIYTKRKIGQAKENGERWAIKITATPEPPAKKSRFLNPFRFFSHGSSSTTGHETPVPAQPPTRVMIHLEV